MGLYWFLSGPARVAFASFSYSILERKVEV